MNCLADKISTRDLQATAIERLIIFLIASIFIICQSTNAQEQWRVFTTANSPLPSNMVFCITIDSNNIKWIGTDSGLVKFDGNNWTIYNKNNSPLPSNGIAIIALDENQNYWMGTGTGGLVKFNGYNNWAIFDTTNSSITSNYVPSLSIDKNNVKWIGTGNKGMVKYNDTNWVVFDTSNSNIPGNNIWALKTQNDIKWVGTFGAGMGRYDNNIWIVYDPVNSGLPSYFVRYITTDIQSNVWIATDFSGVAKFNYNFNQWTIFNTGNSGIASNWTLSILTDGYKKWIGTLNAGLCFYNDTNWTTYNPINSPLLSYTVTNLGLDSNKNLWICTAVGIAIYNPYDIVGIKNNYFVSPHNFHLHQNYPNPFNPVTRFKIDLPIATNIKIKIYDASGKLIQLLKDTYMSAGEYLLKWDGSKYSSGIYFYRLETDNYNDTRKMVLLK